MTNSAQKKPAIHEFHSVPHLYQGLDEPDLLVEIYEYGPDSLEVKLYNRYLPQQKRNIRKQIVLFALTSGCYLWLYLNRIFHIRHLEDVLAIWFVLLIWRLCRLVEYEKLIFCYDFGLHLQTRRFLSKSNTFIMSSNIYDIRINEIIENLDFRYLLIVRTKGILFRTNPIMPIFQVFKPSCDCLRLIYQHVNKVMHHSNFRHSSNTLHSNSKDST